MSVIEVIKKDWYAFYVFGLSVVTALIKWIIWRRR